MNPDLVIRSKRVLTREGLRPAALHIRNRIIEALRAYEDVPGGCPVEDAGESIVLPGLVDTHVHINEPGRTEWEGFETATRAAVAGGITTLIEMPLNSIPATTTVEAFAAKVAAAEGKCYADVGFWGGVVRGNTPELRGLFEAGIFGFKCFLVPSGVEEFPSVTEADLRSALPELARLGAVLLVHAELPGPIEKASATAAQANASRYLTWLGARPREAETEAIAWLIGLSAEFGVRIHVVHLSSSDALLLLRWAKSDGLQITVETCPHYLYFAAEDVPDGATQFKCAPPIREQENRQRLWAALGEGLIDLVVTDHSPCPPEMKCGDSGDFLRAWGGIASLELSLPVMWTAAQERGHTIEDLARWMCQMPARLAGLDRNKGTLAAGYDADMIFWNPEAGFSVVAENLHQRHKLTPYAGRSLHGVVEKTFLGGRKIYDRGEFPASPCGQVLKRPD